MKFSFYKGPVTNTYPNKSITVKDLFELVTSDKYQDEIQHINSVVKESFKLSNLEEIKKIKEEIKRLKSNLDYITVGGEFTKRGKKNLIKASGYAAIDIDSLDTVEELKKKLKNDKHIHLLFISPSGNGLKAIIRVPEGKEQYEDYVVGFYNYLHKEYKIPSVKLDDRTKDISRACFLSYDKDAVYNEDTEIAKIKIVKKTIPIPKKKNIENKKTEKWVETFLINYCTENILPVGDRHPIIEKNLAILMRDRTDRAFVFNKYSDLQGKPNDTFNGWLKNNSYTEVNTGEIINYIKKHDIDFEISLTNIKNLREEVIMQLHLKKRDMATELLVKGIMEENYIYTTREDEKAEMWIYKDGIYVPEGRTYIQEFSRKVLGRGFTTTLCNLVIAKIEADTYINSEEFFENNIVDKIPILNGVLNLRTRELTEYNPENIFFNKLPITYNPEAKCPNIDKFFNEIVSNPKESVKVLYEIFGYVLWTENFIEKVFMFSGHGRNGKSKTIELLKNFIGIKNCISLQLSDIENDQYAVGELFGKMANIVGDLSNTPLKNTSLLKNLAGGDQVSGSRKFKNKIHFKSYAKMIFCANEIPKTHDTTDGFMTKWTILKFPYMFVSQKEIDLAKDKTNLRLADTELIKKITTEIEFSGLLNKALDALDPLHLQRDFSDQTGKEENKKYWIKESDSFSGFLSEETEEDFDSFIKKNELSVLYSKYCRKNNLKPKGTISVKNTMSMKGYYDARKMFDGFQERVWCGVKLKKIEETIGNNMIQSDKWGVF